MGLTIVDNPYKADIAARYKLNPEDSGLRSLYKKIPTNMRLFIENLLGDTSTITEDDFTNDELIEMIALIERQQGINAKEEETLREETEKFLELGMTYKPNQGYIMNDAGKLVPYDNYDTPLLTGTEALKTYENTRDRTSVDPYKERSYYEGTSSRMVDQDYSSSLARSFNDPMYNVATTLGQYTATDVDDGYNIQDIYDFNKDERDLPTDLSGALQRILKSPELAGEYLANLLGSEPRDVNIALEKILKDRE